MADVDEEGVEAEMLVMVLFNKAAVVADVIGMGIALAAAMAAAIVDGTEEVD